MGPYMAYDENSCRYRLNKFEIFAFFLLYTLAHPFYVKNKASVNCKTNNSIFCQSRKKNCACHYYKAAKKIFEISMETLLFLKNSRKKKGKLNYFCPNTQLTVLYSLSLYLFKKSYNSSTKMFYYILTILSQLSMSSFQITKHGQIFNVYKSAVEIK